MNRNFCDRCGHYFGSPTENPKNIICEPCGRQAVAEATAGGNASEIFIKQLNLRSDKFYTDTYVKSIVHKAFATCIDLVIGQDSRTGGEDSDGVVLRNNGALLCESRFFPRKDDAEICRIHKAKPWEWEIVPVRIVRALMVKVTIKPGLGR